MLTTVPQTVVPPDMARNLPLLHTSSVGMEYEVANGGVVVKLGENQADIITKLGSKTSMIMSLHVVRVHEPLFVVSRLVEAGHKVRFDKEDTHILLLSGDQRCRCNAEMGPTRSRSGYVIQVLLGRAEGRCIAAPS